MVPEKREEIVSEKATSFENIVKIFKPLENFKDFLEDFSIDVENDELQVQLNK